MNSVHEGPDHSYIDPEECVGCGTCARVRPVNAIFDEDEVPEQWRGYITKNAAFFQKQPRWAGDRPGPWGVGRMRQGRARHLLRTAASMVVSHAITLGEMLHRPVTLRYPEEKALPPLGSRDIPALKINEATGLLNCTACGLCERTCPTSAIEIVQAVDPRSGRRLPWPQSYELRYDHCMVCNLCVEACPFDALEMAAVPELGGYRPEELTYGMQELVELWKTCSAIRIHGGMPLPREQPREGAGRWRIGAHEGDGGYGNG